MNDALIPTPGTEVPGFPDPDPAVAALAARVADAEARAEAAALTAASAIDQAAGTKPVRYAVYDTLIGRFVGPVVEKRPTKADLTRLIKDDSSVTDDVADLEIREV